MRQLSIKCLIAVLSIVLCAISAVAEELPIYRLEIKDHLFFPSRLEVPANIKFKLQIHNHDDSIEEFDSFDLNREKAIFPGRSAIVFIGPLPPGRYDFFGEYHRNTALGTIVTVEHLPVKKEGKANAN